MQSVARFKKCLEDTVASLLVVVFLAFVLYMQFGGFLNVIRSRVVLIVVSYVPSAVTVLMITLAVVLFVKLRGSSKIQFIRNPRDRIRTARAVGKCAKEIA